MLKRAALLALVVLLTLACHGSSSPSSPSNLASGSVPHGTLEGTVTIGPNCPGPETSTPCPTPPSAYGLRKVVVYDEVKSKVIDTVDIDQHGFYRIDLVPGKYLIDLMTSSAADKSGNVPATVTIQNNVVTRLDINIDTGLR